MCIAMISNFKIFEDLMTAPASEVYINKLYDTPGLVFPIMISLIEDCYSQGRPREKLKSYLPKVWLTVVEYLIHR